MSVREHSKRIVKVALTGFVSTPVEQDIPGTHRQVELADVPVINISTRPIDGLTLHYGRSDITSVLNDQMRMAKDAGRNLYEVKVLIDGGMLGVRSFIHKSDLADARIVSLPRVSAEASEYLSALIVDEIRDLERNVDDIRIDTARLHTLIARYPHLLDALASRDEMRHIAVYVWQADTPTVQQTRLATIYDPEHVIEVRTLNSDCVEAILPRHLASDPAQRLSHIQKVGSVVGFYQRGPG